MFACVQLSGYKKKKKNMKLEQPLVVGSAGSGDGEFQQPFGVAVDSHNNIFVTDGGND